MVRARYGAHIAKAVKAAAEVHLAQQRLDAIEQCTAVLDPAAPWTRCKLLDGHDEWPQSVTCPSCGATSHNPNDVHTGYCGACHDWISDPAKPTPHRTGPNLEWT